MDWYELDGISPDAQAELDLLSATFPELTFDTKENVAIISVPAREGSDGAARAVTADLSLHLPADYPSAACVVSVLRSRGGIQDTELQKQLQEIADGAALGEEPCLYQLIEDARDEMGKAVSARSECCISKAASHRCRTLLTACQSQRIAKSAWTPLQQLTCLLQSSACTFSMSGALRVGCTPMTSGRPRQPPTCRPGSRRTA